MRIQKVDYIQNKPIFKTKSKAAIDTKESEHKINRAAAIGALSTLTVLTVSVIGLNIKKVKPPAQKNNHIKEIKTYISQLAKDLEIYTGEKIAPENLTSVMTKEEFLEAISKLKKENYVLSKENLEKGIYRADLHSHTIFSDGEGTVEDILNQVAEYSNKLNKKTGEKFIFAITDHDNADGVKLALKLILKEPEKFKNTRFVTGSEISYLLKSDKTSNPCETQELLVYGFNPFSKNTDIFFKNLKAKREQMRKNYIKELSKELPETNFSDEEFMNIFLPKMKNYNPMSNFTWVIHHYAQIKHTLSATAKAKNLNPEEYFAKIVEKAPEKLNLYEFKKKHLIEDWISENTKITEINKKFLPEIDKNNKIIAKCENIIDDIADAFKNEENCIIGFAHPYYISERTTHVAELINEIKSKFGHKLKVTESYHQAYSEKIINNNQTELEKINSLCEKGGIIPIGGLDNHKAEWLKINKPAT